MWVILSASVACEATNEAVVAENVRIISMRARKSLTERVMYYGGCVEVLGPAVSDRTVGMRPKVCGEAGGIGACGTDVGAEETRGGTGEAGAGGSLVCIATGDKSPRGLSSAGSFSSNPGGGRWKARALARYRSMVRVVSQSRRRSNRGSTGNPICSST